MRRQSQNLKQVQKALGERIKNLRSKDTWRSQEAFAHDCGINRGHMGQIERGEVAVSLATIIAIAKTLKISMSELFEDIA